MTTKNSGLEMILDLLFPGSQNSNNNPCPPPPPQKKKKITLPPLPHAESSLRRLKVAYED